MNKTFTYNKIAFVTLLIAKLSGMIGIGLAYIGKPSLGALLLLLDLIFIIVTIILCSIASAKSKKQSEEDKDIVARLIKEGVLDTYVRDLKNGESRGNRDYTRRVYSKYSGFINKYF